MFCIEIIFLAWVECVLEAQEVRKQKNVMHVGILHPAQDMKY